MGDRDSIGIARKSSRTNKFLRTNKFPLLLGCDETLWAIATASVLPEKAGLINSSGLINFPFSWAVMKPFGRSRQHRYCQKKQPGCRYCQKKPD
jgi:uncharacterized membrane protein